MTQKVLVVDDDPDFVLSMEALLRSEKDCDVRGLPDARHILQHVADYDPDVVILDIAMPGKTGWEAAREIRVGAPGRRRILIAISGEHTRGSDRIHSQSIGFDFYLMKPCDPKVLFTLLRWARIDSPFRTALR